MKKYFYYIVWQNSTCIGNVVYSTGKKISCIDDIKEVAKSVAELNELDAPPVLLNFILLREEETGENES